MSHPRLRSVFPAMLAATVLAACSSTSSTVHSGAAEVATVPDRFVLGASALALEARLTRRRRLRDIDHWDDAVVTQAHVRGFIVRRPLRNEHSTLKALDAARCATRASQPGEVTHWYLDC